MRYSRGFTRDDGMIFWGYNKTRKNPEIWLSKNDFIKSNLLKLKWQRENVVPEENRNNVKKWYKNNKTKKLASVRKYQILKNGIVSEKNDVITVFYDAAKRVGKCLGIKFHVDHIIPISKGGKHNPSNLQWVPYFWNCSKGNKLNMQLFAM